MKIEKLDGKHFPRKCCGVTYKNAKEFMDHFLPAHEVEVTLAFKSLHWGYGPGLLDCDECGALVLPDRARLHQNWHRQ